jgi:4-hydroxy 2-oxovalerate aldolase
VLIVGGGNTPKQYEDVLDRFLRNNNDILIIYSSSKNVEILAALENYQIHCLPGREAKRLETFDLNLTFNNRTFIIPPHGNYTNIYLPASYLNQVNRLDNLCYMKKYVDSSTAMAIDIAIKFSPEVIYFTGFDGYDDSRSKDEKELFEENQQIFNELMGKEMKIFSLTPTQYNIPLQSIYTLL